MSSAANWHAASDTGDIIKNYKDEIIVIEIENNK